MTVSISGTNGVTFPDGSLQAAASSPYVLKNRIINGDMRIDQRYAGTATANTINSYTLDRWKIDQSASTGKLVVQQNAGSVTPPAGFTNYLGVTSQSAYSVAAGDEYLLTQYVEGYNVADLGWGTANAKTITVSFWVRSSLTGAFGGSIGNSSGTRFYPFSFTISSANTWEQKTVTIAGDTSGTWLTTNGMGLYLRYGLGVGTTYGSGTAGAWTGTYADVPTGSVSVVGTNGATFYITGVQLEIGTSATPFERRMYGQELALCQRYYYRTPSVSSGVPLSASAWAFSTTQIYGITTFPVPLRIAPTSLEQSGTTSDYAVYNGTLSSTTTCNAVPTFVGSNFGNNVCSLTQFTVASGFTAGQPCYLRANSVNGYLGWSAEL